MSKAFTREEGAPDAPRVRPPPRLAPGEKRYVTREGYQRLEEQLGELQQRLLAARQGEDVATANELQAQLDALSATLAVLTVAEAPADTQRVFFGAWVELEDEDGERVRYRLVGPDEADVKRGLISIESPIARALLGKAVGDEVTVRRPLGERDYVVREIVHPT